MNRRPGHVDVTTEVGYCSFCNRSRNLRREEHHLGTLVRTIVTCETCHRTLSSSMGVATPEPAAPPEAIAAAPVEMSEPTPTAAKKPAAKKPPVKKAAAKKPAAKKPAAPAKPKSTSTGRVTRTR